MWDAFDTGFWFNEAVARGCQDHYDQDNNSHWGRLMEKMEPGSF